jgi:hypothetical protein
MRLIDLKWIYIVNQTIKYNFTNQWEWTCQKCQSSMLKKKMIMTFLIGIIFFYSAVNHFDLGHCLHVLNDQIRYVISFESKIKFRLDQNIIGMYNHKIRKTHSQRSLMMNLWSCRLSNQIMMQLNLSVIMMMTIIHR